MKDKIKEIEYKKDYRLSNIGSIGTSIYSSYCPTKGAFSIVRKDKSKNLKIVKLLGWYSCRETFGRVFKRKENIISIYHNKGEGARISKFLFEAEKCLKLKRKSLVSGTVSNPNISVIQISSWWRANIMRMQLLTILLRLGCEYRGNFKKTLYSHRYTQQTGAAVDRFFNGYTRYTGKMTRWHGWRETFTYPKNLSKMKK